MKWKPWSRIDHKGLARYVTPEAGRWLALEINRLDLKGDPDENRTVIEAIYTALLDRNIRYAHEEYHPAEALQVVRTPPEILESPRQGTCLDLAALFCGLCLSNELLPIIALTEGHAFAVVSLEYGLRDWDVYRPEHGLFEDGPLTDSKHLRDLVDQSSYMAIECTGFAHSAKLGDAEDPTYPETVGRVDGVMTFARAIAAGREQLETPARPFVFALDVAIAHYGWRMDPWPVDLAGATDLDNIFEIFGQASTGLSTQIRVQDFKALVDERTRNFVGRAFIFDGIAEIIADPDFGSGYIVIRGEPGIGKTALMGQLVKKHGYVHHFNIAAQNIRTTRDFLTNVCAQLIVRYELDYPRLPPEADRDSGFLTKLLTEASEKTGDKPVVVLVDALDEAEDVGLPAEANRLFLPPALPDGVFFIISTREKYDFRLNVDARKDLYLKDDDPQNWDDVRRYIRNYLRDNEERMSTRIEAWGENDETFVEVITEKSAGNFMYLVHVLRDIREGRLTSETVDDIRKLPKGLKSYYQRHWRTMKAQDPDRFEKLYEPIVCTLAVVRESVTVAQLKEWVDRFTGVSLDPKRIKDVIREWREFLDERETDNGEVRYRVYHTSFQDFLRDEVGLTQYDFNIAQTALGKIPGFGADA